MHLMHRAFFLFLRVLGIDDIPFSTEGEDNGINYDDPVDDTHAGELGYE